LQKIKEMLQYPLDTASYVKKLVNAKHKIIIISNILQSTQECLNKVHQAVEKSSVKRKILLDNNSAYNNASIEADKEEPAMAEISSNNFRY
ncbi:SNARE-associated protein Snapin, partial [Trachymyrmex septentrionalis]